MSSLPAAVQAAVGAPCWPGALGAVPCWPGRHIYPAQPMVGQMRAVLDRYRAAGGRYTERVLAPCGHCPHLERPREFAEIVTQFLAG
jgi:hypothetical protein